MNVLIVEDDEALAIIIRKVLLNVIGVAVRLEHASRLKDALDRLASQPFDVMLLDLPLPDSDGLDTLAEIAVTHPAMAIIVLTGLESEELALEALRRGAQDYLLKGELRGTTLLRSLRYATERNRRERAEQRALVSQERERKRLSRELHDGVIQSLNSMRLQLQILADKVHAHDRTTSDCLEQLAGVALAAIDDVRRVSRDLHPAILEKRDLGAVLVFFSKKIQKETGVAIKVLDRYNGELSWRAKLHLYRVFQEALRNAVVHARAASVCVEFGTREDKLILEIRDSGDGFDVAAVEHNGHGLGLTSIRERAQLLDGCAHIESQKNRGTVVRVELPAGRDFRPLHRDGVHPAACSALFTTHDTVCFSVKDTVRGDQILEDTDADPSHVSR